MMNLEEERRLFSLEECTRRLKNTIKNRTGNSGVDNAISFKCSYGMMKKLYPDKANECLKQCIDEFGFFDLNDELFKAYLQNDMVETIRPIVEAAMKVASVADTSNSNPDAPTEEPPKPAVIVDQEMAKPFQDMLDLLDPGMFEIVEMSKTGKNTGTIRCKKLKPGKSLTVDKINALDDDIAKCKITSDELLITVFRDTLDDMLDFAIQVFDSTMNVVNPDAVAANTIVDLQGIAEQYETSVEDLANKMKSPEGQAWIAQKMSELAKKNASDPTVQELKSSTNPERTLKVDKDKIRTKEAEPVRKVKGDEALAITADVMKQNGIDMQVEDGLQGLFNVSFFMNGVKTIRVAFDVNHKILGPQLKWSPVIPTSAQEAKDAPWFALEVPATMNLLIWYATYAVGTIELYSYVGAGRLYNDEYKHTDTYVSLNEVAKSSMIINKDDKEKEELLGVIRDMVYLTDLATDSVRMEPNSYYRLFKYTSPSDFELISDGRTRNWMNGGKALPVKKSYTLKYKDGKWEASGYTRPKKEKQNEIPKAAKAKMVEATA